MRTLIPYAAFFVLLLTSCANMGRITEIVDPEEVNRENLKNLPYETTPEYGLKVGMTRKVPGDKGAILRNVDGQFTEFSDCYGIKDGGKQARQYLVAVVNGTFECEYHKGKCNGEYDPANSLIIVSYKAFNRKRILPLLKHEWAHVYGILGNDHKNLKTVQKCTRY